MIHELKHPKTKSARNVTDCAKIANEICREKNVTGIAVTIIEKNGAFHTHEAYSAKGYSSDLVGCMEYHKQLIVNKWREKNCD